MHINWMSNAPWTNTGYGNQTRVFIPRFKAAGHDVAITAFYGLEGGILNWDGCQVYPKGRQVWGNDVAAAHTRQAGGQVLITLVDAWVLEPELLQLHGVRWCPWFPIDMEPLPPPIARKVSKAYRRIVFSRFGERMMHDADLDCSYVPHGIDVAVYKPLDRAEVRQKLNLSDAFIVGMVAANKGWPSRKSFPEAIQAFSLFHKKHPDSILYLHTVKGEHGEGEGLNLPELCTYYGLEVGKDVLFPDQYQLLIGYSDEYMNALYNAFDVLLSPSMGEGFGIPIIEAQAAGCPVIVGGWTSMQELCLSGWAIDKADATPMYTTLAAYQFIPHVAAIVDTLEQAYKQAGSMRTVATKRAGKFSADRVMRKYWTPVLAEIEQGVSAWQK
jgi:glycosyltransferase involved in cell wall biosynthesis